MPDIHRPRRAVGGESSVGEANGAVRHASAGARPMAIETVATELCERPKAIAAVRHVRWTGANMAPASRESSGLVTGATGG